MAKAAGISGGSISGSVIAASAKHNSA